MRHPKMHTREDLSNKTWKKEGVEIESGVVSLKCGTNPGEESTSLIGTSTASSDIKDCATKAVDKEDGLLFLVKACARMERNTKVMESISRIVMPTCDSDEEVRIMVDAEGVEWVEEDVHEYKLKTRKDIYDESERMTQWELLDGIDKVAGRMIETLRGNRKAMTAMDRCSTLQDDADDFVPPAAFFATPQASASESTD